MTTYFISDIHLHANSDKNSSVLLEFLQTKAFSADAIYILGDLFAIWFGDDLHLNDPYVLDLTHALRNLVNNNIAVYLMRGNRDFLLAEQFCATTGCKLLPDPCVINLYGKQVLLSHGDLLCTRDHKYQRFRSLVQNSIVKNIFYRLPKNIRLKIGNLIRSKTKQQSSKRYQMNPEIFDVAPETVSEWMDKYSVTVMIHGHTHKPAIHKIDANKQRIVLGDWNENSIKILSCSDSHEPYLLQDLAQ